MGEYARHCGCLNAARLITQGARSRQACVCPETPPVDEDEAGTRGMLRSYSLGLAQSHEQRRLTRVL